jgi:glycosyltransferase involved in cell wall biosynthesis
MRILHLNSLLTGGGTDDRSVRIAHALARLGLEVSMAGPAHREFSKVAQQLGLPFHPVRPRGLPLVWGTARVIRREKIQILHARHGRDYWPAIFAARLSGRRPRIVLSRHLAKSPGSWASRHFLLSQCDAMVAVSHFVAKVLRDGDTDPTSDNPERHCRLPMLGDHSKIHVVYGGFDMDRFKPGEAGEQRAAWGLEPRHYAFAVVGTYDRPRGKGQPEFLKAAAQISAGLPDARFLIIGRGNLKESLEAQIQQSGLQGRAWLTPYSDNMPAAMNALDCLVLPQVGTEAIPGVICEAHACGKPVIASELDGIPEAFAPAAYGRLIPRGSIEALAAAMIERARSPVLDLNARWQLHARVAERFSLERAAKDLLCLYQSLLPADQREAARVNPAKTNPAR